jgi:hypothetical protein
METADTQVSLGKMQAVFLIAGPPLAALVFWCLLGLASKGSDSTFSKIDLAIQLTFNPYGLLATYVIWSLPSLFTYWGCSKALQIARTARQRIVAGACIGALVHFGMGALVLSGLGPDLRHFIAFAGAGGGVSGALCALIVNIYLTSPTEV